MSYHFSRDVSGPFVLECDPNAIRNKYFIKLQLFQNIDFADSLTVSEYLRQKTAFINMNRILDTHFDFSENRYIPGVVEYYLVKITEEEPACVNFGLFFLLTILTFVEFYKIYMNYFSLSQEFTIKKVISTSYDLNLEEFLVKYQPVIPVLNLIKIQYTFQPSDYNYSNESYPLPSKEEVEKDDNKKKINKINKILYKQTINQKIKNKMLILLKFIKKMKTLRDIICLHLRLGIMIKAERDLVVKKRIILVLMLKIKTNKKMKKKF